MNLDYSNASNTIYEDISIDISDKHLTENEKQYVSEFNEVITASKKSYIQEQTIVIEDKVDCRIRTIVSNPRVIKNSYYARKFPNSDQLVEIKGKQTMVLIKDILDETDDVKCQNYINERGDSRSVVHRQIRRRGSLP